MSTDFVFDGSLLCLDLVNTAMVREGAPIDLLADEGSVVRWLREAGQISEPRARGLSRRIPGTAEGRRLLRRARELREAVRRLADAILRGGEPAGSDVDVFNRILAASPSILQITRRRDAKYILERRFTDPGVEALLAPVAESAAQLLTELDWRRLGKCRDPQCVLYFYDTSKNRSRRWCSMERCGNRAKVAAHYHRRAGGG